MPESVNAESILLFGTVARCTSVSSETRGSGYAPTATDVIVTCKVRVLCACDGAVLYSLILVMANTATSPYRDLLVHVRTCTRLVPV